MRVPASLRPACLALCLAACAPAPLRPPGDGRSFLYGSLASASARDRAERPVFVRRGEAETPFFGEFPATILPTGELFVVATRPGKWLLHRFRYADTIAQMERLGLRSQPVWNDEVVHVGSWKIWPAGSGHPGPSFSRDRFTLAPDPDRRAAVILARLLEDPRVIASGWVPRLQDKLKRLTPLSATGTGTPGPGLP